MKFEKKRPQVKAKPQKGFSKTYPMFGFRVPQTPNAAARLERIKDNVEAIYVALKDRVGKRHKVVNRNDILLEALEKGLAQIKKDESV